MVSASSTPSSAVFNQQKHAAVRGSAQRAGPFDRLVSGPCLPCYVRRSMEQPKSILAPNKGTRIAPALLGQAIILRHLLEPASASP